MKNYKPHFTWSAILAGVLLVALIVVVWQWMVLRKAVAQVATKTANPSSSAVSAAVSSLEATANAIV